MKHIHTCFRYKSLTPRRRTIPIQGLICLALTACSMLNSVNTDATQAALDLQAAELAIQETESALAAQNSQASQDLQSTQDALDAGTSIIIEEWDMDAIISGKLGTIMNRCGVKFYRDWIGQPKSKQLLHPINGDHPIHNTPNEGIALTNPSMYWACKDLGDLMELAPGSDATALWGALVNNTTTQLTAVVCMDGQLIIQTYSTHSYGEDRIQMMWENYIYNALKTRYNRISNP